jgi:hypothetical protein
MKIVYISAVITMALWITAGALLTAVFVFG